MRLILDGHRVVYELSAIVSHFHRASPDELSLQVVAYGSSYTAR
jgi:hypothetical protein